MRSGSDGDGSPDSEDFEAFYRAHYRRVREYVARRVPNHDVEDILVEVFAAAARRFDELPPTRARQLGWLIVTARNFIGNLRRSARRSRALSERLRTFGPASPVRHEDRALSIDMDDHRIEKAFDTLSVDDRTILLLVAWDRSTPDELAEIFACSPGAAKTRLSRAKDRFRRGFDEGTGHG